MGARYCAKQVPLSNGIPGVWNTMGFWDHHHTSEGFMVWHVGSAMGAWAGPGGCWDDTSICNVVCNSLAIEADNTRGVSNSRVGTRWERWG